MAVNISAALAREHLRCCLVDLNPGRGDLAALLDLRPQFSLAEAQLLLMLLRRAAHDASLPVDRLRSLMVKLPYLFPLHLRPLLRRL